MSIHRQLSLNKNSRQTRKMWAYEAHNLKNGVRRRNENYELFFFSKLHGTVYFLYNDIASIDIDFDRCVFSSSSFFSFFFCSDIHRHDIDFLFFTIYDFLRFFYDPCWVCCGSVHIFFWTSYFLKLFFFLKLLIFFQASSFQNKKQKEQKITSMTLHICFI